MKFRKVDSSLPAVALITGIAVGAVISTLFTPQSGSKARGFVSDIFTDLTGIFKKRKSLEIKEHLVDDIRSHVKKTADHLTGSPELVQDPVKHTLKQTGPKSRQLPLEQV
ncbi:YtxH domain-containing protein [Pedobacter sp. MC2016-14]|uniref:YtxH domain-containing protein n=1 Tax=Pedobacter sp. MC2016-14 TaxID=2897327 RepID=UPI001E28CFD7|nr:YtxH domain-containing protein [Pedobacter sp. MC2016-14]MCD0490319.1 YtxH domain-containing protein [Pedobacter sp. MC2016-14]